jgi:UDP-N-acetylglucosamine 2-epimerase (non-hydrolysing)
MILFVFGTRPEFIKVKPIIDKYEGPYKVLFTGQHKDIVPKELVDYELKIVNGPNRLDSVVSSCLNNDEIFEGISHVLVQGDTSSVLGIALASFHRGIPVIHLEAGLRTYDKVNPYPEEANRQMVSSIASIHLCPTENNKQNLLNEKATGDIHVVGNTVLDTIDKSNCSYGNTVLITLHRRENHVQLCKYFGLLDALAHEHPELNFILPIHPNPSVDIFRNSFEFINVIDPLPREDLLNVLKTCKFVITDSGGIQEECSYLNKKAIVCREITERPESVGTHSTLCKAPEFLRDLFKEINNDFEVDLPSPYGDGKATEKIVNILNSLSVV